MCGPCACFFPLEYTHFLSYFEQLLGCIIRLLVSSGAVTGRHAVGKWWEHRGRPWSLNLKLAYLGALHVDVAGNGTSCSSSKLSQNGLLLSDICPGRQRTRKRYKCSVKTSFKGKRMPVRVWYGQRLSCWQAIVWLLFFNLEAEVSSWSADQFGEIFAGPPDYKHKCGAQRCRPTSNIVFYSLIVYNQLIRCNQTPRSHCSFSSA